jgi:lipopolysaccharide export system permease protein
MTLLDRYFARRLAAVFLKVVVSLVLLFVVVDLLTHQYRSIVQYEIPARVVALYYLTFVPNILFQYQAAALAVLVSGLMVLGKAAQENQITAALAGGISLRRLARMPLILSALLAVAAFFIQDTLGVRATTTALDIEQQYFRRFAQDDRSGVSWTNLGGGWTCHILKFNRRALTGEDVILHLIQPDLEVDIVANRIYWDESRAQWMLEDGGSYTFYPERDMEQVSTVFSQRPAPFDEPPDQLFALEKAAAAETVAGLREDLDSAEALGLRTDHRWMSYHARFAQPALCFIMMLLALPFALRARRGGLAIGFGLSVIIGAAYVLLYYASLGLGYLGTLPPLAAAWLANVVFLVLGLVLFLRTPT